MKLSLVVLSLAAAALARPKDGPMETPLPDPLPFGDVMTDDARAWAKIYPIMPGFDIYTYPDRETPPSEPQITQLIYNLQRRFRRKSRDANRGLYDADQGYCNIELGSHHGSHCWVNLTPDPVISGNTTNVAVGHIPHSGYPEHGCAWTDFKRPPPTAVFQNGGFGTYGIRWTATKEHYSQFYQGPEQDGGSWGCNYEGLCYPQIVFYRRGYRLVISTWKIPVARLEFCQWDGGFDEPETVTRYELCVDRTHSQFEDKGAQVKYVCAVPCWNDGNIDEPQPHSSGKWNEFERDPEWNETAGNWNWTRGKDTCW